MVKKMTRWLRSKTGRGVLLASLAVVVLVLVIGWAGGWWQGLARYLAGTAGQVTSPLPAPPVDSAPSPQPGDEPRPTIEPLNAAAGVELLSFKADVVDGEVVLTWKTSLERGIQGFNLRRAQAGSSTFARINESLIPSRATQETGGATYAFTDGLVVPGLDYEYRLESVDAQNACVECGTVRASVPAVYVAPPPYAWTWRVFLPCVMRQP